MLKCIEVTKKKNNKLKNFFEVNVYFGLFCRAILS